MIVTKGIFTVMTLACQMAVLKSSYDNTALLPEEYTMVYLFHAIDNTEGGPTKVELLELLQNCDLSASRVSSAVSSRAPSPSPSLMSIVFPGFRPNGGRMSHPGTPINTPSIGRSANNGSTISSIAANVFQPIHVSNSSLSVGSSIAQNPSVVVQVPEDAHVVETSSEDTSFQMHLDWNKETGNSEPSVGGSEGSHSLPRPQKKSPAHHQDGGDTIHQRSRSNEIDYSAIGPSSRGSSSAFKSPPGNARKFRPVSVESTHTSLYSGLSDSSSFGSRPTSSIPNSTSSEVTVTPSNSRPPSRVSSDGRSPPPMTPPMMKDSDPTSFADDHVKVTEC